MSDLRCAKGCSVVATLSDDGVFTPKRARRRNEGVLVTGPGGTGIDLARRGWCRRCGEITLFDRSGGIIETPIDSK